MQQDKVFTGHGWVALLLFVVLLLDGVLSQTFGQWFMRPGFTAVPQLTLITLIELALLLPVEKYTVPIAAVTGLIYDSFYTGLLGVNALLWPLLIYCVVQARPAIPRKFLMIFFITVITLTVYSLANYVINLFLGYGTSNMVYLLARHLGPSLLVNAGLFFISYLPLRRILLNLKESMH
ncbi:rod shape-determining protein MreD [Lacticaseibacillus mingshuiensis]|uniref:Rod shape-determining protein MreD n=1 Tax=Lacticaseibacillus mingshuiensis TaxID=2799574 RepID=A0ABW4CLP0_9LACO|nr:rod shape-determining protein MreD [Lacticaseibacillus mingshuiensis]